MAKLDAVHRRSVLCTCGGDIFTATLDDATLRTRVWRCENCGAESPRRTVNRRTNHHRAIIAYLAIVEEWKPWNKALNALVTEGKAMSGAILVHSSTFNYHLKQLTDIDKPSNFDVRYHTSEARADLRKAIEFIKGRQS